MKKVRLNFDQPLFQGNPTNTLNIYIEWKGHKIQEPGTL